MAEPIVQVFKDLHELSNSTAHSFIEIANRGIRDRGRFLVALSGGNTPVQLYGVLGNEPFRNQVDWNRAHFFWGDERCVPVDHAGNSYGQAKKFFLDQLKVSDGHIHRIECELEPAGAAVGYAQTLKQFADAPLEWPRFDLVLLGMGDDGHTASLFPGSPVEVDSATLAVTAHYQDRPAHRVTLTPQVFNDARNIFFLVVGESKAVALRKVIKGEYRPDLFPAQRINPQNGRIFWFVDEAAASQLKS